jgi:hypothetical protein
MVGVIRGPPVDAWTGHGPKIDQMITGIAKFTPVHL